MHFEDVIASVELRTRGACTKCLSRPRGTGIDRSQTYHVDSWSEIMNKVVLTPIYATFVDDLCPSCRNKEEIARAKVRSGYDKRQKSQFSQPSRRESLFYGGKVKWGGGIHQRGELA
jgi:hypothetical protein